jgi:hypothetical protein
VSERRDIAAAQRHRVTLREGGMLKIQGGCNLRIDAIEGRLWIIQEADVPDVELEAGQSLHTGNVTLVQALKTSTLALVPANSDRYDMQGRVSLVGTG